MSKKGGSYLIKEPGGKPVLVHRTKSQAEADAEAKKVLNEKGVKNEVKK